MVGAYRVWVMCGLKVLTNTLEVVIAVNVSFLSENEVTFLPASLMCTEFCSGS